MSPSLTGLMMKLNVGAHVVVVVVVFVVFVAVVVVV